MSNNNDRKTTGCKFRNWLMTITRNKQLPAKHPGHVFRDRVLNRKGMTITEAAKELRINRQYLKDFTEGKAPITVSLASNIALFTGISLEFWVRLHCTYDVYMNSKYHA